MNSPKIQGQLLLTIMVMLAGSACAQQSVAVTTNRFLAPANFREVQGQLYNVDRSEKWRSVVGYFELCDRATNELILKKRNARPQPAPPVYVDYLASIGGYSASAGFDPRPTVEPARFL